MSYHPTILVYFSRVVLTGKFFFFLGGRSADKRMGLGWRYFVQLKLRIAVVCLNFETHSDNLRASNVSLDGRLGFGQQLGWH